MRIGGVGIVCRGFRREPPVIKCATIAVCLAGVLLVVLSIAGALRLLLDWHRVPARSLDRRFVIYDARWYPGTNKFHYHYPPGRGFVYEAQLAIVRLGIRKFIGNSNRLHPPAISYDAYGPALVVFVGTTNGPMKVMLERPKIYPSMDDTKTNRVMAFPWAFTSGVYHLEAHGLRVAEIEIP